MTLYAKDEGAVAKKAEAEQGITFRNYLKGLRQLPDQPIPFKVQLFPTFDGDSVETFMRVENLMDVFDNKYDDTLETTCHMFSLGKFASDFVAAQTGSTTIKPVVTEVSMTGNQPYAEMKKNKLQWLGIDDRRIKEPTRMAD